MASFFVSRVDTEIDKRLDKLGTDEAKALKGKAGARQRPAGLPGVRGGLLLRPLGGPGGAGANKQRPLWASTGVKDPAYKDTLYVDELVAPGTVNTMPEATLKAYADHGQIRGDTVAAVLRRGRRGDRRVCASAGVDLRRRRPLLEDEGVEKFDDSWNELTESVRTQLEARR